MIAITAPKEERIHVTQVGCGWRNARWFPYHGFFSLFDDWNFEAFERLQYCCEKYANAYRQIWKDRDLPPEIKCYYEFFGSESARRFVNGTSVSGEEACNNTPLWVSFVVAKPTEKTPLDLEKHPLSHYHRKREETDTP